MKINRSIMLYKRIFNKIAQAHSNGQMTFDKLKDKLTRLNRRFGYGK